MLKFARNGHLKKYSSLTYPESGVKVTPQKDHYLSGVGQVIIFIHGSLLGTVKGHITKNKARQ
jgi:hypothetical protein